MFRMPATSELAEPSKMTAEQLKAELSSYNLEVTGRKQLLVDRVTKHRKEMLLRGRPMWCIVFLLAMKSLV